MMSNTDWRDVLGEELAVSLSIPAAPCDRPATAPDVAAHLLDSIALLEDGAPGQDREEAPSEIHRLELKIDLLTDLVSSLLAERIPKPRSLWISNQGMVGPASLLESGQGRIELYPSQRLAQPLVLELDEVRARGDACGGRWLASDSGLREALGRWVFRMHRRDVARRRMQQGTVRTG